MSIPEFRHLHVHTGYSIADGAMHVNDLVQRVKELGMDSVAITDHGNMYGVIDFYQACQKQGIKPIVGMEAYVAPRVNTMKESHVDNANYHLVLLCENNEGYQNLIKISSDAFINGMYYRPRTDIHKLKEWHSGLIALSACLGGEVQVYLQQDEYEKAKETALLYQEVFGGGNYFLELQDHGLPEQSKVNALLLQMHEETGIPLVVTNDCHYMTPEDYFCHDVLMAIQAKTTIDSDKRKKYGSDQFYVKSAEEMYHLFSDCEDALTNTKRIADRCNVTIEFGVNKLPKFDVPSTFTSAETYLRALVKDGAHQRYGEHLSDEVSERMEYELSVIHRMGYDDYFLIVWDFMREAYERGILVGPGRGSAAGSIVSYCLKITAIDPLKYNLMFERFLDPSRISMPDIDIDWQYDRRHEIIDYVVSKYGRDSVCQIITFGTMAAKSSIRTVGRALSIPASVCDKVAKLIPPTPNTTLKASLNSVNELRSLYEQDKDIKRLIDVAMRLEGLPSNTGTHAAGVVICGPEGLLSHIPLTTGDKGIVTQYKMTNLDNLGMLKMDFLGLKTLTVIDKTIQSVKKNYDVDINIYDLYAFEDDKPYELLSSGKTDGLFQLEGAGMTSFMQKLAPTCIEDVIAGISLYRPGPMDSIPDFLENRRHPDAVQYMFPELEPILSNTYGIPVYQEQAMQIVIAVAGYQKSQSDSFRKAIAKKKEDMIQAHKRYFLYGKEDTEEANKEIHLAGAIPGAIKLGKDPKKAEELYGILQEFGKYAFNKSHAAVYAAIGYVTMYLKYYYPTEFMAATIDMDIKSKSKVMRYTNHCKDLDITVKQPDINQSMAWFTPLTDNSIVQSLSVKDTDAKSLAAIVDNRIEYGPYQDMYDYFKRVGKNVNKKTFYALVNVGAFDTICKERKRYADGAESLYSQLTKIKNAEVRSLKSGRATRVTFENTFNIDELAPPTEEYTMQERLNLEREFSGSYLSGHPLDDYAYIIHKSKALPLSKLDYEVEDETGLIVTQQGIVNDMPATFVVIVTEILKTQTRKKSEDMAILTVEDQTGIAKALVFPDAYEKVYNILEKNQIYQIHGRLMIRSDEPPVISVQDMTPIENAAIDRLKITVQNPQDVKQILQFLASIHGNNPVYVSNEHLSILLSRKYWIDPETLAFYKSNHAIPDCMKNYIIEHY